MKYEPWRYTCPNGHNSWEANARGGYRCQNCGSKFEKLCDLKTDDVQRPPNTGGYDTSGTDSEVGQA
jgi:DNA-directed RNA polymerase subunit RPC12/RpoP